MLIIDDVQLLLFHRKCIVRRGMLKINANFAQIQLIAHEQLPVCILFYFTEKHTDILHL